MDINMYNPVTQPSVTEWEFVEELKKPFYNKIRWNRQDNNRDEASLRDGVIYQFNFPDLEKLLETVYTDLKSFLERGNIGTGNFQIITQKIEAAKPESYRIVVEENLCRIEAGDSEGIRRGIYYLEDELLRSDGPFLKKGTIEREAVIKTRISRCFFGPINRPPMNRNELDDNIDYYPDNYLNRLAHEGINGLWLTVNFRDLCPSKFFPEHGKGRKKRLEKLRRTVKKCARYGIKIYIFCIEPKGFGNIPEYLNPLSDLDANPYFAGHKANGYTFFVLQHRKGRNILKTAHIIFFQKFQGLED